MIAGRCCCRRCCRGSCCQMGRSNSCPRRQSNFLLMLPGNVTSHRVVPREGPLAEGTRHSDALMTLPDVGTQVRLVAVQSIAVQTLQLLAIGRVHAVLVVHLRCVPYVQHVRRRYGGSQIAGQRSVRLEVLQQGVRCGRRGVRVRRRWR